MFILDNDVPICIVLKCDEIWGERDGSNAMWLEWVVHQKWSAHKPSHYTRVLWLQMTRLQVFFGTHLSVGGCQLTKERLLYSPDIRRSQYCDHHDDVRGRLCDS
jgi:hypothetical protein